MNAHQAREAYPWRLLSSCLLCFQSQMFLDKSSRTLGHNCKPAICPLSTEESRTFTFQPCSDSLVVDKFFRPSSMVFKLLAKFVPLILASFSLNVAQAFLPSLIRPQHHFIKHFTLWCLMSTSIECGRIQCQIAMESREEESFTGSAMPSRKQAQDFSINSPCLVHLDSVCIIMFVFMYTTMWEAVSVSIRLLKHHPFKWQQTLCKQLEHNSLTLPALSVEFPSKGSS